MESYLSRWARVAASVMSLTATNSSSELASWAARNRLRPIRPKPLIPTFTRAMTGALLRCFPSSVRARRDLYTVSVRVAQVGRVVGGTVLGTAPRRTVVAAAGGDAPLPRRLDRWDPLAREADVATTRAGRPACRGEEEGLDHAPSDHLVAVHLTPPAQRTE